MSGIQRTPTGFDRRNFLVGAASAAGALAMSPGVARASSALPNADGPKHLVLVFLNGGNDGLNTLVPTEDDRYHAARPNLALQDGLHRLDDLNAMHPSLPRLAERYREGGVGFLRGVGYSPPNLSHFSSRDIWDAAKLDASAARTGWIGRMVDARLGEAVDPTAMISVGGVTAPMSMLAERNMPLAIPDKQRFRVRSAPMSSTDAEMDARRRALESLNRPEAAGPAARIASSFGSASAAIALLEDALEREPRAEYPDSALARDLGIVARAIDAELSTQVFVVDQAGYDTHAAQANTHTELLSTFDGALDAFVRDIDALGRLDRTLIVVYSEFGRRVAENGIGGNAGTDHGAAGLLMTLGGASRPGIHGGQPDLGALDDAGNVPATTDFRAVYSDIIGGWFGTDPTEILGGDFGRAGILRA